MRSWVYVPAVHRFMPSLEVEADEMKPGDETAEAARLASFELRKAGHHESTVTRQRSSGME